MMEGRMFRLDTRALSAAAVAAAKLDSDWRAATGLSSRADYSIHYAPLVPCPLMVLGLNPGGSATNYKVVDVDAGQNEYIEGHGPTAQNIGRLLRLALEAGSPEDIRGIPGSNVIWRRSPNQNSLRMSTRRAAIETAPHLARLMRQVGPRGILFAGSAAFDAFRLAHEASVIASGEVILGPNGSNTAIYFAEHTIHVPSLGGSVAAFIVLHPSKGLRQVSIDKLKPALARLLQT